MSCNTCPAESCGREAAFKERLRSLLAAMGCQYPSLFITADFWRPKVISNTDTFADEDRESWIRLDERVAVFKLEQADRFYQDGIGIVNRINQFLLLPSGMDLQPDDHVLIAGEAWLIIEVTEQMGVCKLKIDRPKSRFIRPGRFDPTYREIGIKGVIL